MRVQVISLVLFVAGSVLGFLPIFCRGRPVIASPPFSAPPPRLSPPPPPPPPSRSPTRAVDPICGALRPLFDPGRSGNISLEEPGPRATEQCRRFVQYPIGFAGIGHRLGNWMAGMQISLVWGLPAVLQGGELDQCGPHGCYKGAEDSLGLSLGHTPRPSLEAEEFHSLRVNGMGRASLKQFVQRAGEFGECKTIFWVGQEMWFRDLTLGRWALANAMLRRIDLAKTEQTAPLKPLLYSWNEVSIAVHIRYGGYNDDKTKSKSTPEEWLKLLLSQVVALVANRTRAKAVAQIKVVFHVFTGGKVWPWLRLIPSVVIHATEMDGVQTWRHMAFADILVCGHSSMCFHAALASFNALAIVPLNMEPFPYNMCPGEISCVDDSGVMGAELRVKFLDAIERSELHRSRGCTRHWE